MCLFVWRPGGGAGPLTCSLCSCALVCACACACACAVLWADYLGTRKLIYVDMRRVLTDSFWKHMICLIAAIHTSPSPPPPNIRLQIARLQNLDFCIPDSFLFLRDFGGCLVGSSQASLPVQTILSSAPPCPAVDGIA